MEDLSDQELYQMTIKVIEPFFNEQLKRQTAKVVQSIELGRASDKLDHIVKAILNKEVKNLYLANDKRIYGSVDWTNQNVKLNQGVDTDILEELAEQALQRKAKVYSVPKDWLNATNGILVEYF